MTRKQARKTWQIIKAYGEGSVVQVENPHGDFTDLDDNVQFNGYCETLRIKPTPRLRPMTRGEVLFKVTTTPGMVVRLNAGLCELPTLFTFRNPEDYEWAIIDPHGNPIDGWHKFETTDDGTESKHD